ncbi:MAG: hypothetical protein H7833_01530 [Magnetococcus sp. DMHC-1]
MNTQEIKSVTFVESDGFAKQVDILMSGHEKEALYLLLGSEPMRGQSSEHKGILIMEWGKQRPLLIGYMVSETLDEIFLL